MKALVLATEAVLMLSTAAFATPTAVPELDTRAGLLALAAIGGLVAMTRERSRR